MKNIGLFMMVGGFSCMLAANVIIAGIARKREGGYLMALMCLLLPIPYSIVIATKYWKECRQYVIGAVVGLIAGIIGISILALIATPQ